LRIYLSLRPRLFGGGSNTFSSLFANWARKRGHKIVSSLAKADAGLVIAHLADEEELRLARERGAGLVHRLDEHFEPDEDAQRRAKHDKIKRINALCQITVYQSEFVRDNVQPHLGAAEHVVIYNGTDPKKFKPAKKPGEFIGHVTWGVGEKKRLDLLHAFILSHPGERFLLVGRHKESGFNFRLPNVKLAGKVLRGRMPAHLSKMKMLYFPSENDPCPNTAVEAIVSGVPICYNFRGGTVELVRGPAGSEPCGLPLDDADELLRSLPEFRERCLLRPDLHFESVALRYEECLRNAVDMAGRGS